MKANSTSACVEVYSSTQTGCDAIVLLLLVWSRGTCSPEPAALSWWRVWRYRHYLSSLHSGAAPATAGCEASQVSPPVSGTWEAALLLQSQSRIHLPDWSFFLLKLNVMKCQFRQQQDFLLNATLELEHWMVKIIIRSWARSQLIVSVNQYESETETSGWLCLMRVRGVSGVCCNTGRIASICEGVSNLTDIIKLSHFISEGITLLSPIYTLKSMVDSVDQRPMRSVDIIVSKFNEGSKLSKMYI